MSHSLPERSAPLWMLSLMLLISGNCALMFQVVWIRELRLVFGATTASSAAVLAIFMAGLGLGNWIFGKRIDQSLQPLRYYGLLELGIAISAGLSPLLILMVRHFYLSIGGQATLGPELATLVRLAASACILAIPTLLMGGTMPAAARAVSNNADQNRRGVGLIYGLNTLGAVIGAGFANFLLLEALGNHSVLWTACTINIILALIALTLSKKLTEKSVTDPVQDIPKSIAQSTIEPQEDQFGIVCLCSGVMGFVFFLMEIVWYRMLGPLLGGTTYTFGLILCVALLGIGIGGAVYGILARSIKPSLQFLAIICSLEALLIALPFWYGDQIAFWVMYQQSKSITSFTIQVWHWLQIGAFVIFPAALIAGFQFPLLISIAGKGKENVAKHVGWTFAANTLGAITGSIAGGFFLLPIMTAPGLWRFSVCLLLTLAVLITLYERRWKSYPVLVSSILLLLSIFAISDSGPTAVWRHAGIGARRARLNGTGKNAEQNFANMKRRQCIWEAEGRESSVAITATDSLAFIVNGKSDGNAYGDAGTQIGLGLLGPLLHQSATTGLVIGLGTGESAGWLAAVSRIKSVDVVELEPVILEMTKRCAQINQDALDNPKLQLHFNDAREYLLTTKQNYDLIISEPSNPFRAGIANLYTQEFYKSVAKRLHADGLFLQWLQGYEVDDRTVNIVLQTLRSVFPEIQIWRTKSRDMVLVCGKNISTFNYDIDSLHKNMNDATIKAGLKQAWRVTDLEGLLAHYVCSNQTIDERWNANQGTLNRDDRNLLEYAFAKTVGTTTRFSIQKLYHQAVNLEDHLPVPLDQIKTESVTQRQLAMQLHLGGIVDQADYLYEDQQNRIEAYDLYLAKRYHDATYQFKKFKIDSSCAIESLIYAHTLAETGNTIPTNLMHRIQEHNPSEATAIRAIFHFQQKENNQALQGILTTLKSLQSNPWGKQQLLNSILQKAVALSDLDSKMAAPLYQELKHPFALYRLEDTRLMVRYIISEKLDKDQIVESLEPMEPNIPWKGWLLENRKRVYSTKRHPLAYQAKHDLAQFKTWNN